MRKPTSAEYYVLIVLAMACAAYNWAVYHSILENHTIFGGMVAGWSWCLVFHRHAGQPKEEA